MLAEARHARGWWLRQAARRAPSLILAESIIDAYGLDGYRAAMLLSEAVDNAGKSSPYRW